MLVEGHSEVESVPVIMRRLLADLEAYNIDIHRPIRVKRNQVVKPEQLERSAALAHRLYPDAKAIVLILDADDDCPKELAPALLRRLQSSAQGMFCSVVLANHEMEAWFLASIESLRDEQGIRGETLPPGDPEAVRDAKGWLTFAMEGRTYVSTDDQPAFAASFDFAQAYARCRSFRKFRKDFTEIVSTLRSN